MRSNATIPPPSDLLTTEEAAAVLRLSPRTLRRWRDDGDEGPAYARLGRRILYRRRDLDDYVRQCLQSG